MRDDSVPIPRRRHLRAKARRRTLLLLAAAVSLAGCARKPPVEHADGNGGGTVPTPAAPTPPTAPAPRAVPPTPRTDDEAFEKAFAAALALSDRMDEQEPAATARRLAAFKEGDRLISTREMAAVTNPAVSNKEIYQRFQVGLEEWATRQCRKVAKSDARFRSIVRAVWKPESGAKGILGMMNLWGVIPPVVRDGIADGVKGKTPFEKLPAAVRDELPQMAWEWPYR